MSAGSKGGTQQPPGAELMCQKCSKQPHKEPNVEPLQRCRYSDSQHQPQQRKRNQNSNPKTEHCYGHRRVLSSLELCSQGVAVTWGHESGGDQCRCWHRDDKNQLGPGPEWIVMAGAPAAEQRRIQEDRGCPPLRGSSGHEFRNIELPKLQQQEFCWLLRDSVPELFWVQKK